jgi:hypothetical protein
MVGISAFHDLSHSVRRPSPRRSRPAIHPTPSSPTTTFHSDILHFDYTYDSSFAAMPDVASQSIQSEKDKATGAMKAAISCVTLPLVASDSSNGLRMIMILRMDGACLGTATSATDLGGITTSTLSHSLQRFGDPQMGTVADYQVAGHAASNLSGTVKSEKFGATFYGTASCLLQGADFVCWEFLASDCSKLPDLMANPIQFSGQPAEALIPKSFAQTCKQ